MSKNLSILICSVIVLSALIYSQLFCSVYAQEKEIIKVIQVKVEGTKNVSSKEVIEVIKTKKGKGFVPEVLDEDLQAIYDMKLFSNVEIDVSEQEKGVVITFLVTEKPIVKKVDFRGNENMSRRVFNEKISLKKNGPFDEETMEEDRIKIASLYKDKGHANVKVEAFSNIDEETGKINVIFFVVEGKKITIGRVDIVGVNLFSKKKILKLIKKTRRKKVLKEDLFKEDLNRITAFYRNRGYLDVKIADPEITYTDEETKVNIVINIIEGVKYSIGTINFAGNNVLTNEVLKKVLELKDGEIYNQEKFDKSKQNIGEIYAEKGYIFIKVEEQIRTDSETKIVNIDFNISEGPLAYVGKIFVTGNNKTKEYVIRREILLKEGEPFNGKKVRRSQEKIYNLGYFKEVNLNPRPSEEDRLNLIFDVVEQPTSKISAGIGYSSVDKLLGTVELGINNLFGRGQRLSLLYEIGERKKSYEVDFIEPWLFGYPYSFGTGIYDKHRKKEHVYDDFARDGDGNITLDDNGNPIPQEKTDDYWEERKGGSIRVGYSFSDFYSIHFGYKYEDVAISETDQFNDVLKVKEEGGWEATSSLSTTFVRDSRDNIFDASRGSRHSFSAEVAGGVFGGNHHFTKYIADSSWYFPTIYKFVLALHLKAGVVDSFGASGEVPIYEKFYVGGAETVRGYNYYGEIGPSDGGKSMITMNIEYKYSIPETPIQLAIFYDAGNAWETIAHPSYDLKESVGFGIRFLTPVFPIRLDYGYGLQHKPGEPKGQWHFSVGQVF